MKTLRTLFFLFGILCIFFSACKKDDDNDETTKNGLSGNVLSGKIQDWPGGSDYYVLPNCESYNSTVPVGQGEISSGGAFSFTLEVPEDIPGVYSTIGDWEGTNITVSDPTTESAYLFLDICDNDGFTGQYLELNNNVEYPLEGHIYVDFFYFTKDCTINGFLEDVEGNTTEHTDVDLNLKAGWNAVAWKIENITSDGDYIYKENKVSTDMPSSLTWKLMDYKK